MIHGSNVRDHILRKERLFRELRTRGFHPHLSIVIYVIVKTLPPAWPRKIIQKRFKKKNYGSKGIRGISRGNGARLDRCYGVKRLLS